MEFIYSKRWCELVFESRNKKYGAYILRMREANNTIVAWLISASFLILIVATLAWNGGPSKALVDKYTNPIVDDGVFIFADLMPPLPRAETPKTTSVSNSNATPIVVDDKIIVDNKKIISHITPVNPIGTGTGREVIIPNGNGGAGNGLKPTEATQPILVPDVMPEFPGGQEALLGYLQKNIHYPFHLVKNDVTGIVYLSFVIDKKGEVTGIKILRGVKDGEALSDEAIRVVKQMPQWKPGMFGGQNVDVQFTLPVNFVLK